MFYDVTQIETTNKLNGFSRVFIWFLHGYILPGEISLKKFNLVNFSAILVSYVVLVGKQLHKWPINLGIFQTFIHGLTFFLLLKI